MLEAGIPSSISNSAGTYVCNHAFYCLMHAISNNYPNIKGGFIHVPTEETIAIEKMALVLESAIKVI